MTVGSDLDLEIPGAAPEKNGRPLTVLQLLEEMKAEEQRQKRLIDEAEVRERIVFGEQWRTRDAMLEDILPSQGYYNNDLIQENLLYPLVLTYAARVDQGRIDPRAFPFQPTAAGVEEAKSSNTILDFEKQRCDEGELISEGAVLAQCHGDCLFYPQWSEADGPHRVLRQKVDQAGPVVDGMGQPVFEEAWEFGGVVEEVIAAPDYLTSGEDHYKRATWLRVRRVIDKNNARDELRRASGPPQTTDDGMEVEGEPRFPDADPEPKDFPTAMDLNRRGVECFEMWLKPGPRCPEGAFCMVVDGKAVKAIPYPTHPETGKRVYDGELPGDIWKIGFLRGNPRGKTHVSDAIHQQRLVNTALRAILARAEIAKAAHLVGPSDIINAMPNAKTNRVPYDGTKDLRATMQWFVGEDIPPGLMKVYVDARAALNATFGVSDATATGGDPTETKSGIQLREATALDAQKIRPARNALENARKKVSKDKLSLWQVHADEARYVRVLGPGGAVAGRWLRGADIGGADVALEIGSGIQSTHIAGQRDAEQSAEAGYLSPQNAIEMRQTGLPTTVGEAESMARIDAQAQKAAKGEQVDPLPEVDPQAAIKRLHTIIGSLAVSGQDPRGVVVLAQKYEQLAAAKAQAGANLGPGRAQPGTPPPMQKGAVGTTDAKNPKGAPQ